MRKFVKNHVGALIAWIVILLIAIFSLPNVSEITRAHSNISLPSNVQSSLADNIKNEMGPKKKNTYEIAVVFNKKHGKLTEADKSNINQTVNYLKDHKSEFGIKDILAPDDNIATRQKLQSKNGTTWVMQLNVAKSHGTISQINQQMQKAVKTQGVATYVTGADILTDDFSLSIQEGIKKTELITVIFIFIVLIIVFRSPIVPLVSLLTVGISFLTSFSIVTNLVKYQHFPLSNFTQVFMVIVLFGIGTDYNILLYDKFKENLGKGMNRYEASNNALKIAGKTILFSGSSILIGFTALGLAKFSVYQSAVGVAVGVAVLLIVLLTLNSFFMRVLGKKMFWPVKKFEGETDSKLWHGISKASIKHAIAALVLVALICIPLMLMYNNKLNYDDTDEIADNVPSKAGLRIVQKNFSKGMAMPSVLYIKANHRLDNETNLELIDRLTQQLQSAKDVSFATSVTEPYGEPITQLYVNNQMNTVNSGVDKARGGLNKLSKGSKKITKGANKLSSGADQLESGTSQLAAGANQLQSGTARLQAGAGRLESGTLNLQSGTQQLVSGLNALSNQLSKQMGGASGKQIRKLQSALPQINSGIQRLNNALGGASAANMSDLRKNLQTAAAQAQIIGQSLQTAQAILQQGSGSSSSDAAAIFSQAISQANNKLAADDKLTATQQAALAQAVQKVLQDQSSAADPSGSSSAAQLKKALETAGKADQKLGSSLQSIAGSSSQAAPMLSQIAVLKKQVKQLATASNVALPGAASALNQLTSGLNKVQSAVIQGRNGASRLNSGAGRLASGAAQLNSGLSQGASGAAQLAAGAGRLESGTSALASGAEKLATSSPALTSGIDEVNDGLGTGSIYLKGLAASSAADTFYIPKEYLTNPDFKKSIDVYLSPNKKIAQLYVVFNSNPSATEATNQSQALSDMARKSLKGTALGKAKIEMGGQSSKIKDTKSVASSDFIRTAAIMLIGIGLALIFVTRSLLQPIYILGTLMISYIGALSINQWITNLTLHRDMLTWNTPFFGFIMLIALGVDYSIFVMTRYNELKGRPSEKILRACSIIGTVVISAAVILGGTFAALIPSGIPTLIEVAITVIVGLLILVFLMPITLSATTRLTYENIKFPSFGKKKKEQSKN